MSSSVYLLSVENAPISHVASDSMLSKEDAANGVLGGGALTREKNFLSQGCK